MVQDIILSKYRNYIVFVLDILIVGVAYLATIMLLNYNKPINLSSLMISTIVLTMIYLLDFIIFRIYRSLWRYAEIREFATCIVASLIAGFTYSIVHWFLITVIPFSENLLAIFIITFLLIAYRFVYRIYRLGIQGVNYSSGKSAVKKRVLLVGGGDATALLLAEWQIGHRNSADPICIADDDNKKLNKSVHGIPVMGKIEDIPDLCQKFKIDSISICIPSATVQQRSRILDYCAKTPCPTKIMPSYISKMISVADVSEKMRSIALEDLLNRDINIDDSLELRKFIEGKVILVTGGGGSIGSELCRQIAMSGPKKLIILDIYENNAYDLQQEILHMGISHIDLQVEIASVRDEAKMEYLFDTYRPDYVFHAAAHKHVPLMEHNPEEAVKNNIVGTYITANLAEKYGVKRFVLISTDKAVRPSSFMGATKRLCEMIVQSKNGGCTEFVVVRFGNVLGSNGSVVPLFQRQIKTGGPVYVTHKDITRYFMTIPEAVNLVLQAGAMAHGGEIFVLNMGEPVKILSLAENMIKMQGYVPYKDIDIKFTGLRPGEKLYEELLLDEEAIKETVHQRIFKANQIKISREEIADIIVRLQFAISSNNIDKVFCEMGKIIPSFSENHYVVSEKSTDIKMALNEQQTENSSYDLSPAAGA